MISLEQIRELKLKVDELLTTNRKILVENKVLKKRLDDALKQNHDLQKMTKHLRAVQAKVAEEFQVVMNELDNISGEGSIQGEPLSVKDTLPASETFPAVSVVEEKLSNTSVAEVAPAVEPLRERKIAPDKCDESPSLPPPVKVVADAEIPDDIF